MNSSHFEWSVEQRAESREAEERREEATEALFERKPLENQGGCST
jgi:hypothetical protein